MGKGRRIKFLRKLAASLPPIERTVLVGTKRVPGWALYKDPAYVDSWAEINPQAYYMKREYGKAFVNHRRKVKRLYNSHRMPAVAGYCRAVNEYAYQRRENRR